MDLPSGWAADETAATVAGPVFPADAVITFTAPKPAHVFGQLTRHWYQPVVVAPIGSPEEAVVSALGLDWAGSALALAQAPRPAAANKGNFGHVLVVGGTLGTAGGKSGAPAMAALAALRAGAGLVTAAVPAPALPLVAAVAPELMTWPLAASAGGLHRGGESCAGAVAALMAGKTVLAIGPGMGQSAGDGQIYHRAAFGDKDSRGDRRRCAEYSGREAGAAGQAGQGPHAGAHAASRRDGAAGGNDGRRGAGQPAGGGARLCAAHSA